ncbi:hypothetical protein TNCV_4205331 [Trichonephila clavipes]|nr:hypothetical protein TNCV_4205331 [Trichonephila clavipes]
MEVGLEPCMSNGHHMQPVDILSEFPSFPENTAEKKNLTVEIIRNMILLRLDRERDEAPIVAEALDPGPVDSYLKTSLFNMYDSELWSSIESSVHEPLLWGELHSKKHVDQCLEGGNQYLDITRRRSSWRDRYSTGVRIGRCPVRIYTYIGDPGLNANRTRYKQALNGNTFMRNFRESESSIVQSSELVGKREGFDEVT